MGWATTERRPAYWPCPQCRHLTHGNAARLHRNRDFGVDEHKWKHVRGDGTPKFDTAIADLTTQIDGVRTTHLLDMVPDRSAEAYGD